MNMMEAAIISPIKSALGWQKPVPPESVSMWLGRQVYLAMYLPVFVVLDAMERLVSTVDGMDKTNKMGIAVLEGIAHFSPSPISKVKDLRDVLKSANDFFGMTAVFGRMKELISVDHKSQQFLFVSDKNRTDFKRVNQVLLFISKYFEAVKWLLSVDILASSWFVKFDKSYLGGVGASIGNIPLVRQLEAHTLGGGLGLVKDVAVSVASLYGILDSIMQIAKTGFSTRESSVKSFKALLSIAADIGKIILALWYKVMIWFTVLETKKIVFIAVSLLTAGAGITKILLDSYDKQRLQLA